MLNNAMTQALYKDLKADADHARDTTIAGLFSADPERFASLSYAHDGMLIDLSKTHLTQLSIQKLISLGQAMDIKAWTNSMFTGDTINTSEGRSVLHTALRSRDTSPLIINGHNIRDDIAQTLDHMRVYSDAIRNGVHKGATGSIIKTIIHIGIGGSDLGPRMICDALESIKLHKNGPKIHFVSNVDPTDLDRALQQSNPVETLIVIASKTFTTAETMMNAAVARQWLLNAGIPLESIYKHLCGISSNKTQMSAFGIHEDAMFSFGDYVGGRYSLWSCIGLSICLCAGYDSFRSMLDGAYSMDTHFLESPLEKNLPFLLGMAGIWHRNILEMSSLALLPYLQGLNLFPAYVQQLDMESNGKSIQRDGQAAYAATGPVIFGVAGTNFQHSFGQLLHQGTDIVPVEFIGVAQCPLPAATTAQKEQHTALMANMLAQSQALAFGQDPITESGFYGNRPNICIMMPTLTPYYMGMLLALYEHKVFVQGIIWKLNSFDQPGVELGKKLAKTITPLLTNPLAKASAGADTNPSTAGLIDYITNS